MSIETAESVNSMKENPVPMRKTQAPGFFRTMVGDYEVTALFDSSVRYDASMFSGFTSFTHEELSEMLRRDFVPLMADGMSEGTLSVFLVNTGNHLILIDAGIGETESPVFLDTKGHLTENLVAAGYAASDVDVVLPTHLHFDHINGIMESGEMVFPNATIYLAEQEKIFWLDTPMENFPEAMLPFVKMARDALLPYRRSGRIVSYASGSEVFPNVKSVPLFGHTPGHTGFEFSSRGQNFLAVGDFVHIKSVQLPHPEVGDIFDTDAETAAQMRLSILPQIAERRILVAGAHFPFPGLGYIKKESTGYRWIPIEFRPIRN